MSNYPWGGRTNPNPYTTQNPYDYVGIQPIGTGFTNAAYPDRPRKSDASIVVSTVTELYDALATVTANETIWVEPGDYDITGQPRRRQLPAGATLASDGARIYASDPSAGALNGVLELVNDGSRVTGLRFEGDQKSGAYSRQTIAILARADCRIDNCEFYHWQTAGIYIGWPTDTPERIPRPHIHHCVGRDIITDSLGYAFASYAGDPLYEYNFLNANRISFAGSGGAESSYRAYNNLFGEDHPSEIVMAQNTPGGKRMEVWHNEIKAVQTPTGKWVRSYAQRGIPSLITNFFNNWSYNPNPPTEYHPYPSGSSAALVQYNHDPPEDWINVDYGTNHYGSTAPTDSTIGIQPLTYATDETLQWPGSNPPTGTDQGTSITLPGDNATQQATHRQGIVIQPAVDLAGLRARISSQVSGYTTAYITKSDGTVLTSTDIRDVLNGGYTDLVATLTAGNTYLLVMDAGGASYTRGAATSVTYPYGTSQFSVTAGVYSNGGSTSAANRYNFDGVQALVPEITEAPSTTTTAGYGGDGYGTTGYGVGDPGTTAGYGGDGYGTIGYGSGTSTAPPPAGTETRIVTIAVQDEHGNPIEGATVRVYEDL